MTTCSARPTTSKVTGAELHAIAYMATGLARTIAADWQDRYETAWSAAAELAIVAPGTPQQQLINRAADAIDGSARDDRRHHGLTRDGAHARNAVRYWTRPRPVGVATAVVERLAVRQILPALPAVDRQALEALAAHGSRREAAAALGLNYRTFALRVQVARGRFLELWNEADRAACPAPITEVA